jgi:hypothetical protein
MNRNKIIVSARWAFGGDGAIQPWLGEPRQSLCRPIRA